MLKGHYLTACLKLLEGDLSITPLGSDKELGDDEYEIAKEGARQRKMAEIQYRQDRIIERGNAIISGRKRPGQLRSLGSAGNRMGGGAGGFGDRQQQDFGGGTQLQQMQSRSVSSLSASSTAVYRHEKIEVDNAQKLNITTPIARTDVAMGQRTYQSTIVDGLESRYGMI